MLSNDAPALTALRFLDIPRTYSIDINGTNCKEVDVLGELSESV